MPTIEERVSRIEKVIHFGSTFGKNVWNYLRFLEEAGINQGIIDLDNVTTKIKNKGHRSLLTHGFEIKQVEHKSHKKGERADRCDLCSKSLRHVYKPILKFGEKRNQRTQASMGIDCLSELYFLESFSKGKKEFDSETFLAFREGATTVTKKDPLSRLTLKELKALENIGINIKELAKTSEILRYLGDALQGNIDAIEYLANSANRKAFPGWLEKTIPRLDELDLTDKEKSDIISAYASFRGGRLPSPKQLGLLVKLEYFIKPIPRDPSILEALDFLRPLVSYVGYSRNRSNLKPKREADLYALLRFLRYNPRKDVRRDYSRRRDQLHSKLRSLYSIEKDVEVKNFHGDSEIVKAKELLEGKVTTQAKRDALERAMPGIGKLQIGFNRHYSNRYGINIATALKQLRPIYGGDKKKKAMAKKSGVDPIGLELTSREYQALHSIFTRTDKAKEIEEKAQKRQKKVGDLGKRVAVDPNRGYRSQRELYLTELPIRMAQRIFPFVATAYGKQKLSNIVKSKDDLEVGNLLGSERTKQQLTRSRFVPTIDLDWCIDLGMDVNTFIDRVSNYVCPSQNLFFRCRDWVDYAKIKRFQVTTLEWMKIESKCGVIYGGHIPKLKEVNALVQSCVHIDQKARKSMRTILALDREHPCFDARGYWMNYDALEELSALADKNPRARTLKSSIEKINEIAQRVENGWDTY